MQNVGGVVTLASVKPQANDLGKDAPATTAQKPEKDGTVGKRMGQVRDAFKGTATVDCALEITTGSGA